MQYELCIIGGAGHVGLPLGVAFANAGVRTVLLDTNREALEKIQSGRFPFREKNGAEYLRRALEKGLKTSGDPSAISRSDSVLLVIGTPVDRYLNPDIHGITGVLETYLPHFRNGQMLILRSTVYPGTSERIQKFFENNQKRIRVTFCPERIAQGRALGEIKKIPQIVSAFDPDTLEEVSRLFRKISPRIMPAADPIEAELAKLFSNAWRYIKFAVANQFFMIANDHRLDYHRIHKTMTEGYPRNADLPQPGFAAGPCLFKDTMQLAAFHSNNFFMGHAAMLINEGLPHYVVQALKHRPRARRAPRTLARFAGADPLAEAFAGLGTENLHEKTIGILGMAFKGDSDDSRDSLAYKLRKVAQAECKKVLCADAYIKDPSFVSADVLIRQSDIVILAAPHSQYRAIDPRKFPGKVFVDIWNFWPRSNQNGAQPNRKQNRRLKLSPTVHGLA